MSKSGCYLGVAADLSHVKGLIPPLILSCVFEGSVKTRDKRGRVERPLGWLKIFSEIGCKLQ